MLATLKRLRLVLRLRDKFLFIALYTLDFFGYSGDIRLRLNLRFESKKISLKHGSHWAFISV